MNPWPIISGDCNQNYSNETTPINPQLLEFLSENYEELFKLASVMDRKFVERLSSEVFRHIKAKQRHGIRKVS